MFLSTSFILSAIISVSVSTPSSRVVGGTNASSKEFPFVVDILLDNSHRCAGFIYNTQWVVTSAVCIYGFSASQFKVVTGQLSLTSVDAGEQTYLGLTRNVHPKYNSASKENNIAMLQVSVPFSLGDYASIIVHEDLPSSVSTGIFLGWGSSIPGGALHANLQKSTVSIDQAGTCNLIDSSMWNSNLMICAGDGLNGGCSGDYGGPLVIGTTSNYSVVGILSHINTLCSKGAYVKLSEYTDWMISVGGTVPTTSTTTQSTTSSESTSATSVSTGTTSPSSFLSCNLAEADLYPFMVSIGDQYGRHFCSGFIYNTNYIVTSGSCAKANGIASGFKVYAGILRLNDANPIEKDIQSVIYEKDSGTELLALIKLASPFSSSDPTTINLIKYETADYANPSSTIIGWASPEVSGCSTPSLDLLWGSTNLIADCSKLIPSFDPSFIICAGVPAVSKVDSIFGSCRFEGGAPLVQNDFVVGVKILDDSSEPCTSGQAVSTYVRIASFFAWFNEVAGRQTWP